MNYFLVSYSDSLRHHGIRGQEWGKRNGPPYPLDKADYSAREKRQNSRNTKIKRHLTDSQKKAIKIGAVATGVAIAAIGGYALYKTGALKKVGMDSLSVVSGTNIPDVSTTIADDQNYTGLYDLNNPSHIVEALNKTNPDPTNVLNRSNCGNSVLAFEQNMRGINSVARNNTSGLKLRDIARAFNNLQSESIIQPDLGGVEDWSTVVGRCHGDKQALMKAVSERATTIEKALSDSISKQYSEDARGCIMFTGANSAHFFSWIKEGNIVRFVNPQDPSAPLHTFIGTYKHSSAQAVISIRLDNIEFNDIINDLVSSDATDRAETFVKDIVGSNFVIK